MSLASAGSRVPEGIGPPASGGAADVGVEFLLLFRRQLEAVPVGEAVAADGEDAVRRVCEDQFAHGVLGFMSRGKELSRVSWDSRFGARQPWSLSAHRRPSKSPRQMETTTAGTRTRRPAIHGRAFEATARRRRIEYSTGP